MKTTKTHAKSIVFMASVVSVSRRILHARVIFEGPSMIVGLKIQRTPELSTRNNKLYHRSAKLQSMGLGKARW